MENSWQTLIEQARKASIAGNYSYAETIWTLALQEAEDFKATEDDLMPILEGLGESYCNQGHYRQAEKPVRQLLEIRMRKLGGAHIKTGDAAHRLAVIYHMQQKYGQAEPLYAQAFEIKKIFGVKDPDLLRLVESYSDLFNKTQRPQKAAELQEALRAKKVSASGAAPFITQDHLPPIVLAKPVAGAKTWEELRDEMEQFYAQGNVDKALELANQAIALAEKFPEQDSRLARSLDRMGEMLHRSEKYGQAEMAWWRSLQIKLKVLGDNHPEVANTGNQLAGLHYLMGRFSEAENYSKKCQTIYENVYGAEHPNVAVCMHNLASLYHVQGRYGEAEVQYKRAVDIRTKTLGEAHNDTISVRKSFADMLKTLGREAEAQALSEAASGLITGTWKAVVVQGGDSLREPANTCFICKSKLAPNDDKCNVCGAGRRS
jgi:tetratricopeptide (TPR) repeat protein